MDIVYLWRALIISVPAERVCLAHCVSAYDKLMTLSNLDSMAWWCHWASPDIKLTWMSHPPKIRPIGIFHPCDISSEIDCPNKSQCMLIKDCLKLNDWQYLMDLILCKWLIRRPSCVYLVGPISPCGYLVEPVSPTNMPHVHHQWIVDKCSSCSLYCFYNFLFLIICVLSMFICMQVFAVDIHPGSLALSICPSLGSLSPSLGFYIIYNPIKGLWIIVQSYRGSMNNWVLLH